MFLHPVNYGLFSKYCQFLSAVFNYSSKVRGINAFEKIKTAEMRFLRPMAGYTRWDKNKVLT